jgi:transposase-like protein
MKTEMEAEAKTIGRRAMRQFSAKQKSQAVLALWSGRRSTSSLSKELGVPWGILRSWESRALSGMLTALDPNWRQPAEKPCALPERLEKLLIQTTKPAAEPESEPKTT